MKTNEFACGTSQRSNPFTRTFALIALSLVATGCRATAPQTPLSDSAVRLDLPLVHQDALYDCGLASISALCQYWGVEIPDNERIALARTAAEEKGLSGAELCTALQGFGLETFLFQGSLDRKPTGIYEQVDAGRPPLVMVSADGTGHHYELVLGYDEPRANLILLDPVKGEILVPVAIFERNWERCQRFTLLACPSQAAPATSSVQDEGADSTSNPAHAGN